MHFNFVLLNMQWKVIERFGKSHTFLNRRTLINLVVSNMQWKSDGALSGRGAGGAVQTQLRLSRSHRFPSLPQRRMQPTPGAAPALL